MTFFKILKKLLLYTSVYFTLSTPIYAAIQIIANVSSGEANIEASRLLLLFAFSFLAGISQLLYSLLTLHKVWRITIQYAIIVFATYVCLLLPSTLSSYKPMTNTGVMVGLIFATVIYFACVGICAFFKWRFLENTKKDQSYENKFKK